LPGYGAYTFEHATESQRSAFAESYSPPADDDTQPTPVKWDNLSHSERFEIVERAMRLHGFVDADGNVVGGA
jgi:hypothetical protein